MEFPTIDKFAKEVAEKALDEITYEGKTVREWVEIIVNQQQSEDCRNCKKWNKCPCGKEGHENGTSIGYSIGECKDYEPCEDCISRESIVNKIHALQNELTSNEDSKWNRNKLAFKYMAYVNGIILNEPPVTPQRPKGKWIYKEYDDRIGIGDSFFCSECGEPRCMKLIKYCPNCGAEMSGGGEDGNSN